MTESERPRRRLRRWVAGGVLVLVGFVVATAVFLPGCLAGERHATPPVTDLGAELEAGAGTTGTLKVITINLAHGRADGVSQMLCRTKTIRANLDAVGTLLAREAPHVVAMQEADGPSVWSGSFDHVAHVARAAGLRYAVRGEHVRGLGLSYGAALASALPMTDAKAITFEPAAASPCKGYVLAAAPWPGRPELTVYVASLHLDYKGARGRDGQIDEVIDGLAGVRPLVLMGDFNCGWLSKEDTLRRVCEELDLSAWRREADDIVTFPRFGSRIDWVLISPELEFVSCEVLPDVVSDHRAVAAVLAWREQKN